MRPALRGGLAWEHKGDELVQYTAARGARGMMRPTLTTATGFAAPMARVRPFKPDLASSGLQCKRPRSNTLTTTAVRWEPLSGQVYYLVNEHSGTVVSLSALDGRSIVGTSTRGFDEQVGLFRPSFAVVG